MDRKQRRALELFKDLLIVLLTCSALWLAARSQLLGSLSGLWREDSAQTGYGQSQSKAQADAARPLRITANLRGGTELARYGVQYDAAASDALFQQVASLLAESLSSAGTPEKVTREQWEQALRTAPAVSLDFQGAIPMPVLVGWLAGENTSLTGAVRRLTLTVWQESVALYYRDEKDGSYYRSLSEVANPAHLAQALASLGDNGSFYAFESEVYQVLDPDTLLTGDLPPRAVYAASNPMSGERVSLEALMKDLGFTINNYYPSGDEQVGRSGNDTVRLSDRGVAVYTAGGNGSGHFQVSPRRDSAALLESVEVCRQLAADTVGARCGQAQLYLMYAKETGQGLEVAFGYSLNGVPVRLEGEAAHFVVKDGQISRFTLRFRNYADTGKVGVVLPLRQAAAALTGMDLEGAELQLVYQDSGGDVVAASWVAATKEG